MSVMANGLEVKETSRIEAFSDGVFAFAITLLVLYLKDPASMGGTSLLQGLISQWPSFLAFVTSFMTILVMWVNHHNMFKYIKKIDTKLMFLNGFLLFFVVLLPFTTSLIAGNILSSSAKVAAAIYSGALLLTSIFWYCLWRYASRQNSGLLQPSIKRDHVKKITSQYNIGLTFYFIAFAAAYFSGLASFAMVLLIAVFFAVTASIARV
jgi:uncharacterized membrane protein